MLDALYYYVQGNLAKWTINSLRRWRNGERANERGKSAFCYAASARLLRKGEMDVT